MELLGRRKTSEQKQSESQASQASTKCTNEDASPNQPVYSDLGKKVKNLLTQGFSYGSISLHCKMIPACSDVEVGGKINLCQDTSQVLGQLSAKITCPDRGIALNTKTYSDQKVTVGLTCSKLLEGVKLAASVDLLPVLRQSEVHAKTTFQTKRMTSRIGFDFTGNMFSDTALSSSVVIGHKNYSAGMSFGYDISGGQATNFDVALARSWKGLDMLMSVKSWMSEFHGMMRADYSDNVEVGAEVIAKKGNSRNCIGVVAAYNYALASKYCSEIVFKGKVNTDLDIGLSAKTKITDDVFLTVSALIHGHDMLNYRCHKWGVSLRF